MVLNGTGDYKKAAEAFNRAVDLEPTNDLAYLGLATAYERLGRHVDAEQTYRRAIELRPHYWASYNNLGAYYYRSGRYDDALAMFQQVVALAPDSFRGYSSVGAVQFMKDRIPEAIAAFQQSLAIRPNFAAASNLGTLYYFEGQFRLAAETFRQALSFDQNRYQVWGNLAQALEQAGDKEETSAAFTRARELAMERLEVNPRDAALHIAVAEHNAALGEMDKAKVELSTALALAPDDAHTLFQIGVFYESRLRVRNEALKWLSLAVDRGQTWREIDRAPELRALRTDPRFQQLRRSR
jgi:Tfp pilus assembly protein PilF